MPYTFNIACIHDIGFLDTPFLSNCHFYICCPMALKFAMWFRTCSENIVWSLGECFWSVLKLCPCKSCAVFLHHPIYYTIIRMSFISLSLVAGQDRLPVIEICVLQLRGSNSNAGKIDQTLFISQNRVLSDNFGCILLCDCPISYSMFLLCFTTGFLFIILIFFDHFIYEINADLLEKLFF